MIRHIVMWRVRAETEQERALNRNTVKQAFESLQGRIPGMHRLEIGLDNSRVDYACDVVLLSDFETQAALDAYATHPEHLHVRTLLGDLRVARHQVDYLVE